MRRPFLLALGTFLVVAAGMICVVATGCGGASFSSETADAGGGVSLPSTTADAGSFCAREGGAHQFCDDFDTVPLSTKWDSIDQGAGGTAVTDSTISYSPPASFKAIAPASLAAETRGRVVKAFGTASRIVIDFEVSIDATPVKLATDIAGGDSILAIYAGTSYTIGLRAHTDEVGYYEDLTSDAGVAQALTTKDLVATPTLQGWTSVAITIDFAHANLSISIGGVQLIDDAPITPPSAEPITVYLGAFSRNEAESLGAHYDNVTIDTTP